MIRKKTKASFFRPLKQELPLVYDLIDGKKAARNELVKSFRSRKSVGLSDARKMIDRYVANSIKRGVVEGIVHKKNRREKKKGNQMRFLGEKHLKKLGVKNVIGLRKPAVYINGRSSAAKIVSFANMEALKQSELINDVINSGGALVILEPPKEATVPTSDDCKVAIRMYESCV